MTNENDAVTGQATVDENGAYLGQWGGLTKREYFAAMAMQGFASDNEAGGTIAIVTDYAVRWADALIEAFNKETR